jgi:hypothetical protein
MRKAGIIISLVMLLGSVGLWAYSYRYGVHVHYWWPLCAWLAKGGVLMIYERGSGYSVARIPLWMPVVASLACMVSAWLLPKRRKPPAAFPVEIE